MPASRNTVRRPWLSQSAHPSPTCFRAHALVYAADTWHPIRFQIRLTRNNITDAGVASIIAVQIAQASQAASSEGAGGVRAAVLPASVKGFGAVMTESEAASAQVRAPA
jgi:hypothetical protein